MTGTGTVMGTPHYMSPEQVRGQKADARSDVFALGCIFYELLTGKKPFDAESMHGVLFKVMQEEPVPLGEAAPGLAPVLVHVVERSLAKDPTERYQNAAEMLTAMRQARQAVAGGRGLERNSDLERPAGAARPGVRAASDRGSRPLTRPPVQAPARRGGGSKLVIGIVVGLAALAGIGWGVSRYLAAPPAAVAPVQAPEVRNLAQAVIDTQVELARRRLAAGDFTDAARKAEGALKLDPQNAAAHEVLDAATKALKQIETAVAAVQAAGSDRDRLAAAAFELMSVDPGHAEAARAATAAGPSFRGRAEEARGLSHQERLKAEKAGADRTSAFAQGADLERQGDRALEGGQLPAAARRYLEARSSFAEAVASR